MARGGGWIIHRPRSWPRSHCSPPARGRRPRFTPLPRPTRSGPSPAAAPATGKAWGRLDPKIAPAVHYGEGFPARGVAYWRDRGAAPGSPCAERIFLTTNDRRLIALDAAGGKACAGFGRAGTVDVAAGVHL